MLSDGGSVRVGRAVLTLRCTQRVRARLRLLERLPQAPAPSGALGDWYVHLVRFAVPNSLSRRAGAACSRCCPRRELRTSLVLNLCTSLRNFLLRLEVPPEWVSRELAFMQPASFARAANRRVLGSMNDLAIQASHHRFPAVRGPSGRRVVRRGLHRCGAAFQGREHRSPREPRASRGRARV